MNIETCRLRNLTHFTTFQLNVIYEVHHDTHAMQEFISGNFILSELGHFSR